VRIGVPSGSEAQSRRSGIKKRRAYRVNAARDPIRTGISRNRAPESRWVRVGLSVRDPKSTRRYKEAQGSTGKHREAQNNHRGVGINGALDLTDFPQVLASFTAVAATSSCRSFDQDTPTLAHHEPPASKVGRRLRPPPSTCTAALHRPPPAPAPSSPSAPSSPRPLPNLSAASPRPLLLCAAEAARPMLMAGKGEADFVSPAALSNPGPRGRGPVRQLFVDFRALGSPPRPPAPRERLRDRAYAFASRTCLAMQFCASPLTNPSHLTNVSLFLGSPFHRKRLSPFIVAAYSCAS
jgi:hypothetical protein